MYCIVRLQSQYPWCIVCGFDDLHRSGSCGRGFVRQHTVMGGFCAGDADAVLVAAVCYVWRCIACYIVAEDWASDVKGEGGQWF